MKTDNRKGKRTGPYKRLLALLLLEFIIIIVTAPFFIFYGPFDNIKGIAVGSIYNTLSGKALVEAFLSDSAIQRILAKDGFYTGATDDEASSSINFKVVHSEKIDFMKIDGGNLMMKGYMLIIHDPTKIKVGYSSKLPIEGESISGIAKRNKAVAAINAGGFGYNTSNNSWTSTGGNFEGYIMHEGKVIGNNLKGGEKEAYDAIGFDRKGRLIFGKYSIKKLQTMGVDEALCFFGPRLIVNGKRMFKKGETGGMGYNPRTAIGQKATGEVIMVVIEGRDLLGSTGASMYDLQEIMKEQGAVNAINLDGGHSTGMYYDGKLVNKASNTMGERTVPTVFMVSPGKGASN